MSEKRNVKSLMIAISKKVYSPNIKTEMRLLGKNRRSGSLERLTGIVRGQAQNFSVPMACPECGSNNITDTIVFNKGIISTFKVIEAEVPGWIIEEEKRKQEINTYKPGNGGIAEKERYCHDCEILFTVTGNFTYQIKESEER